MCYIFLHTGFVHMCLYTHLLFRCVWMVCISVNIWITLGCKLTLWNEVMAVQVLVSSISTILNTSLHFGLMLLVSFPTFAAGSQDYKHRLSKQILGKYSRTFTVTSIRGYFIIYYFGWTWAIASTSYNAPRRGSPSTCSAFSQSPSSGHKTNPVTDIELNKSEFK